MEKIAASNKTSNFQVILLAYHLALSKITGIGDIAIAATSACRTAKYMATVGFFAHAPLHRIKLNDSGKLAFLPVVIGFWSGILFLLLLDTVIPHLHMNAEKAEGVPSKLARTTMMVLAVTLHNIPEGMAVGIVYAGFMTGSAEMSAGGAFALALGIAIQNFPEGAIISMPLHAEGKGRGKAFWGGVLSGAVEPIGAALTILFAGLFLPAMPYLLSFAAGAMIYVVVEELIPEMSEGEHSNIGVIMFSVGFTLMMVLDVVLG